MSESYNNVGKRSVYGRLFWTCTLITAWCIILFLFVLTLTRFFNDRVSIGVETTYLHWKNTFPAVSICLSKSKDFNEVTKLIRMQNVEHHVPEKAYSKNIHDYLFTNPNNLFIKEEPCKGLNSTCGVDVLHLRKQLLPTSCSIFVKNISFMGSTYEKCEDLLMFHELEMGFCFLANNLIDFHNSERLPLKFLASDRDINMQIVLRKGFLWNYQLYIHSPEDIPFFNSMVYDLHSDATVYSFNIEEIFSNKDLKTEDLYQRKCKFLSEIMNGSAYYYSYSACMAQIRIELELSLCNCTLFTSPKKYSKSFCDIKGIQCLSKGKNQPDQIKLFSRKYNEIQKLTNKFWIPASTFRHCLFAELFKLKILICFSNLINLQTQFKKFLMTNEICFPSCIEQQLSYVGTSEQMQSSLKGLLFIRIELNGPPTLQFHRKITQSKLDLLVSIGGIVGLFIGASLLNIMELLYFFAYYCTKFI